MTSPDNKVPPIFGTVGYPGLSGWAAMTQQDWETWMRNSVKVHIDPLESFFDTVQKAIDGLGDLLDGIVNVITGGNATGVIVDDAVAALTTLLGWVRDLKTTVGKLLDGLAGVVGATADQAVAAITKLAKDFGDFIKGLVGSSGTVAQAVAYLTDIYTRLKELVDGLGGVANSTVAAAIAAVNKLKTDLAGAVTNLQALVDGIWKAFTGGTGAGKTIAEALSAITNWLLNQFQGLVDGIVGIFNPGATNRPILDAINSIGSIFGTATNADTSAANAHAEIEAIKASQSGGFSDTFETTAANNLSVNWKKLSTGLADSYGPDGAGAAVGKMSGNGLGWIRYCNIGSPVTKADMKVTATLSRLPWWDAFVRSAWMLTVQNNTTNQECYGVVIEQGIVAGSGGKWTPFYMDAAGAMTNIGAQRDMPTWGAGVPYTLEIKGTTLNFYRNNILQGNAVAPNGALAGRLIGFGGSKVAYTSLNDNPLAQFAGISWQ